MDGSPSFDEATCARNSVIWSILAPHCPSADVEVARLRVVQYASLHPSLTLWAREGFPLELVQRALRIAADVARYALMQQVERG
eukprot:CAMPEP_0182841096 /NCGR_PEP_ID=MMETSP0006_2-20121128/24835_1 /TAXON_ID=97485 /ORGANISM="Prymnesium parvum, Strain Texoma1" /LENGTH=83 /DNA_ID=CAMNT_0024970525 /DNA_START=866 /DNA_END=1113 /DNA_ORIENTATION=+